MKTKINKQYVKFACRYCGKQIVLKEVRSGKKVPFDAGDWSYNLHKCKSDDLRAILRDARILANRDIDLLEEKWTADIEKLKTALVRGNL